LEQNDVRFVMLSTEILSLQGVKRIKKDQTIYMNKAEHDKNKQK
jgi:hypothetical protein